MNFKSGDKVLCVSLINKNQHFLKIGSIYTVYGVSVYGYTLEFYESKSVWSIDQFIKLTKNSARFYGKKL